MSKFFKKGQEIFTYDDDNHRTGFVRGIIVRAGKKVFWVKWDDEDEDMETEYPYTGIDMYFDNLMIEKGCPMPPPMSPEDYRELIKELRPVFSMRQVRDVIRKINDDTKGPDNRSFLIQQFKSIFDAKQN